ncbi:hypothetical protein NW768_007514 [Fusarium equiseti]|uniref:NB-ARC domain-containing protein n=1 Tax=Fusarium equiseti TaxID=61235 RepID=A0ABQ8R852_FUSEQ|nr:hypothetical protein NW768_007514 [Fusarium equiseti]
MEAVGAVANIIAVVDLSAKVATLCYRYSQEVSSARADIERLRRQAEHLEVTLNAAKTLVERRNSSSFSISAAIIKAFDTCRTDLEYVLKRLDPNPLRTAMRRYGLRSLKWPFKSKEIDRLLTELKSYENTISVGLQLDQSGMLESIKEGVDRLQLRPTEDDMAYKKHHLMVPFTPDPDFVHRSSIEDWMKDQFDRPSQRMALVGMGGFGKSKLAIQFGHQVFADPGSSVFWVHGGNKAAFEESYRALADLLDLPRRHESEVNILALVRDWLQRDDIHPWFMIVDNADDGKVFFSGEDTLYSYLPKSTKGKVLVTSRSLDTAHRLIGNTKMIHRIQNMAEDQALELLQSLLETKADENDARDLVHALDFIPLAVKQAAAYINRRYPRVNAKSYLEDFFKSERRKVNLLLSDKGDLDRQAGVSNSVVVTWQVTFKQIRDEHPSAANLLSLMSQFQPQNIPEFMLQWYDDDFSTDDEEDTDDGGDNVTGRGHDEYDTENEVESEGGSVDGESSSGSDDDSEHEIERIAFEGDLDALRSYSLVDISTEGQFSMHSLIQFCTRQWISELGTSVRWNRLFVKLAARHFPYGDFENWPTCQVLLPHVEPTLSIRPLEQDATDDWAELLKRVSHYFQRVGQYSRAQALAEVSVGARSDVLGQDHFETLESKSTLASILYSQGKLKEAHDLGAEVVKVKKATLGVNHKMTLASMYDLAVVLYGQGRLDEAKTLSTEVLVARQTKLGPNHPNTLQSMADLGQTLRDLGRLQEAERLQRKVLEKRQTTLGHDHPNTLTSMNDLGLTLNDLGRLQEAESLQREVLAKRQATFGYDHPNTLTSMNNLSITLQNLGQLQEAERLQMDELQRCQVALGLYHPDTLISMGNLGLLLRDLGRLQEAEELEVETLGRRKTALGLNHPDTLLSMHNLAYTWHDQARLKEALSLMEDCACLTEGKLGHTHPYTQSSLRALQKWRAEIPLPEEVDEEWELENV